MSNGDMFEALIASGMPFEFEARDCEQNESNDRDGYTGRWYSCRVNGTRVTRMWYQERSPVLAMEKALAAAKAAATLALG